MSGPVGFLDKIDVYQRYGAFRASEEVLGVGISRTYHVLNSDWTTTSKTPEQPNLMIQILHVIGLVALSVITVIFLVIREVNRARIQPKVEYDFSNFPPHQGSLIPNGGIGEVAPPPQQTTTNATILVENFFVGFNAASFGEMRANGLTIGFKRHATDAALTAPEILVGYEHFLYRYTESYINRWAERVMRLEPGNRTKAQVLHGLYNTQRSGAVYKVKQMLISMRIAILQNRPVYMCCDPGSPEAAAIMYGYLSYSNPTRSREDIIGQMERLIPRVCNFQSEDADIKMGLEKTFLNVVIQAVQEMKAEKEL